MLKQQTRISIIGTGYVGLCTAVGFASKGYMVIATDNLPEKVEKISQCVAPFHEPGLTEMLEETTRQGLFRCLANATEKAVLETDLTYVAVGTPSKTDGSINLQFIKSAAQEIGKALKQKRSYHVVVVKSTVVPGTTQNIVKPILEQASGKVCGKNFGLCMNPEFLRQGSAFKDTKNADRVVIGGYDKKSADTIAALCNDFYAPEVPPIIRTTLVTAELIKYASNSMLATKISFINTLANICEKIPGADVKTVATAMGLDKRIGSLFLDAGLGYGGSCFPKDLKALIASSKSFGYTPELLEDVEKVNAAQPMKAVEFCRKSLGTLSGKRIAILGLAFKPNTDDMRETRAKPIIDQLTNEGAHVVAYDPVAIPVAKTIFQDKIEYASSALRCLKNADAAILVTEWPEFKKLTLAAFKGHLKQPILFDGRRIYDPKVFGEKLKFGAIGLGN